MSLAEMRVVPDADYQHAMGAFDHGQPTPCRAVGRTGRATIKYRLKQPLFTAAALVAARLNLHSPSLGGGTSEVDPDGKRQTAWGISSQNGRGLLFLGDKEIIYTESYLDDGRRYTDEIARQRRDALFANPANITSMMKQPKVVNREAIRIPPARLMLPLKPRRRFPSSRPQSWSCHALPRGGKARIPVSSRPIRGRGDVDLARAVDDEDVRDLLCRRQDLRVRSCETSVPDAHARGTRRLHRNPDARAWVSFSNPVSLAIGFWPK